MTGRRVRLINLTRSSVQSMALSPSTRLGPYSVIVKIGEGDMDEVYRAIRPTQFLAARGHAQC